MIALGLGDEPQAMKQAVMSILPHIDAAFVTLTGPKDQMDEAEKVLREIETRTGKPVNISFEREEFLWTITKKQVNWLKEFFGWDPVSKEGETVFKFDEARNYN